MEKLIIDQSQRKNKPFDVYEMAQIKAIENVLSKNNLYFYRKICRWFSETFSTELVKVYKYPHQFVLLHYYEHELDRIGYNAVYDMAAQYYVPELADKFEENNRKFAESLVKEQKATIIEKNRKEKSQSLNESEEKDQAGVPIIKPISLKFDDE